MASIANSVTLPCGFTLPNRLVKAAMAEQMADSTNLPNEDFKRVYQNWAKGGWGMVITGNVQVDPAYLGSPKDLSIDSTRLSDPAYQKVWKDWAQSCTGSPTIVQINHPGRQSPMGAGTRSMSAKTVAPSAIPLDFGPGLLQRGARNMVFGTPRALSTQEVEDIITQFVQAAKFCYDSGFDGVEIHAAHGYLLAQFLSKAANRRDDEFGGDAGKRAEIIVRIIKRVREATSPGFVIGMKMNSVDVKGSGGSEEEALEQVARFWGVGDGVGGLDFLEISGGTYEEPEFLQTADEKPAPVKSASTAEREAFFLKFASLIRSRFPSIPLIVTGGFRSLSAMNQAVESKQCDFIGLGRPAAIAPLCPKTLLGVGKEEKLVLEAPTVEKGWWMKAVSIKVLGAGAESDWYAQQIQKLGK